MEQSKIRPCHLTSASVDLTTGIYCTNITGKRNALFSRARSRRDKLIHPDPPAILSCHSLDIFPLVEEDRTLCHSACIIVHRNETSCQVKFANSAAHDTHARRPSNCDLLSYRGLPSFWLHKLPPNRVSRRSIRYSEFSSTSDQTK